MPDILYASVSGDAPRIAAYRIDAASGGLTPAGDTPMPGSPAALAASPDRGFLYADVTVDGVHQAHSFRIDPATGSLSPIGVGQFGPYPCHLWVDRTGRFLLAAYYSDGMVTVHGIGADGVAGERVQLVQTAPKAHYIQTDAANRFAFAPHVGEENAIWQFRFDAKTGQLSPNDPPKASPGTPEGPRHMCFHPNGRYAFSNGEQGSSVTSWAYDAAKGTLAPLRTESTLPPSWRGTNSASQIHITPDGRFLYSCNRGHHSLAGFRVDAGNGALASLGLFSAEATPRPTAISADSRWLYNAGSTPRIVTYRIGQGGDLQRLAHLEPGPIAWLLAVRVG